MLEIFGYTLSTLELLALMCVAILIGMSKTGVAGAAMIAVPIMAILFGGKESTGLILTILIFADVFGVGYYHRHADWSHLKRLLPLAFAGVLLGVIVGEFVNDAMFRTVMAIIIFCSLGLMVWLERNQGLAVPQTTGFIIFVGVLGGFTTMVGNLAGPVMALYLLAMRFPKNEFIGTAAWFFLTINLFKVPFHVFVWGTITWQSFFLTACLIPAIALGAFLGIWIVRRINETSYRYLIIATTALAAAAMLM